MASPTAPSEPKRSLYSSRMTAWSPLSTKRLMFGDLIRVVRLNWLVLLTTATARSILLSRTVGRRRACRAIAR